jgi:type I restriction enzyme S subunit
MVGDFPLKTTFEELIAKGDLQIGDGYRAKNNELGGNGIIFLRAGHVNDRGIDFSGVDRFNGDVTANLEAKTSKVGDTIVTTKGNSTGRSSFVEEWMPEFVYSPHLSFWRSGNQGTIDNGFLRYWSKSKEFLDQLNGMKVSTDMAPYLSLTDQRRLRITLTSIQEQRFASQILSTLDDKIELNRKTNETLEGIAKALFKSWFVDFDPVRAKAEGRPTGLPYEISELFPDSFEESELGEIPSGWAIAPLDDIACYLNGLALQKFPPQGDHTDLPVIKIAQLRKGDTIDSDKCSNKLGEEYVIKDGDVLFSWSGSLLVDTWTGGKGALNQHLFKVTSEKHEKWFFYLWTKRHLDDFQAIAESKATTMGHIQRRHLSEAMVLVPPSDCLDQMTRIFAPLLEGQIRARLESRNLASIRDALLPRLISGEIRVPDAEKMLEEVGI